MDSKRDRFWSWMTEYALKRADMLLSDCAEVSEKAIELAGFDPARIVQFPWGVDTKRYRHGPDSLRLKEKPGWQGSVIIICVRSWESNYGVKDLLEAFSIAQKKMPALRLVLLGSGSLKADIEQFICDQNLANEVLLPGAIAPDHSRSTFVLSMFTRVVPIATEAQSLCWKQWRPVCLC